MTLTYREAADLLATARNADAGKPLANNTRLFKRGDDYVIRLHSTDIVLIHADGTYTLDSGGWRTLTTKSRMNDYTPATIAQERGIWYVRNGSWDDPAAMYEDGMKVDANGAPLNPVSADKVKATEKAGRKLSRMVSKFIKGFLADLAENGLRNPSGGDCWGCYFAASPGRVTTGSLDANGTLTNTTGKADPMGVDHLLSHMKERYYVPSLLWVAVRERAGDDHRAGFQWHMIKGDLEYGREPWLAREALKRYFANRRTKLRDELLAQAEVA
jgi:hypothetical protein